MEGCIALASIASHSLQLVFLCEVPMRIIYNRALQGIQEKQTLTACLLRL